MTHPNAPLNCPLRMALIGGGGAGFIGRVHLTAATLDRRAELVAGVFSSNAERSKAAADEFGVAANRAYGSVNELISAELQRPPADRIDFVSIATPNDTHFPIAKAALDAGFNVVCDKPLTTSLADARELARLVESSGAVFVLTHNYTGYPMVRQARDMVVAGDIGDVFAIRATYLQGWLHGVKQDAEPARGSWKGDPKRTGPAGTLADVGTHAFNLARFVTGLQPVRVSCRLKTFAPNRQLDDYGHALVEFETGAVCMVTVSQVTHGRLNDLTLEVDGMRSALSWRQEEPNQLFVRTLGQPMRVYERDPNAQYTSATAKASIRLPSGHPEAFFEAFANVYRSGFDDMVLRTTAAKRCETSRLYPDVQDGVEGVRFIEQSVASSNDDGAWKSLIADHVPS